MAAKHICFFVVLILVLKADNVRPDGSVLKCCGVHEQFDSAGQCVPAPWPPADVDIGLNERGVVSGRDESWTSRWCPPGLPRRMLVNGSMFVTHSILSYNTIYKFDSNLMLKSFLREYNVRVRVNQSYRVGEMNALVYSGKHMVVTHLHLVRPKPHGGYRLALYCVDAIEGRMDSYVLVFRTLPGEHDLFMKCCNVGEVVFPKHREGLECDKDPRAWMNPTNASFPKNTDFETPFVAVSDIIKPVISLIKPYFHTSPLPTDDDRQVSQTYRYESTSFLSSMRMLPCTDLKRDENGALKEVLGYFAFTRHTRAAYMISRHLSYVSALILLTALVAIGCKGRMRSSAHGWALGCHIVCLLFFNIGQIVFTLTMSAEIENSELMTIEKRRTCLGFAIPMYFLLTGASAWMTAVSANMFFGFKITGWSNAGGGDRKRFLKLSAFAWSAAATLTGASAAAFLSIDDTVEQPGGHVLILPWYRPTFAETRTCFNEIGNFTNFDMLKYRSQKLGTALYYYAPTLVLMAANVAFLCLTGLKVSYLRRGNSLLKRLEREGGGRRTGGGQQNRGSTADPKSGMIYTKLLLSAGTVEFLAELITWAVSWYHPWKKQPSEDLYEHWKEALAESYTFQFADHSYAHRTVGYWSDLFRALVVLLVLVVAPDLRAAWRRTRGKGGDSPSQTVASTSSSKPRRGRQQSAV